MKVKELIEQLKECDADSDVYTLFEHDNPFEDEGFAVDRVFSISCPTTKEVHTFIPSDG